MTTTAGLTRSYRFTSSASWASTAANTSSGSAVGVATTTAGGTDVAARVKAVVDTAAAVGATVGGTKSSWVLDVQASTAKASISRTKRYLREIILVIPSHSSQFLVQLSLSNIEVSRHPHPHPHKKISPTIAAAGMRQALVPQPEGGTGIRSGGDPQRNVSVQGGDTYLATQDRCGDIELNRGPQVVAIGLEVRMGLETYVQEQIPGRPALIAYTALARDLDL